MICSNVFAVIIQSLYGVFLYLVSVRNATANAICIPQIDQISLWGKGHTPESSSFSCLQERLLLVARQVLVGGSLSNTFSFFHSPPYITLTLQHTEY